MDSNQWGLDPLFSAHWNLTVNDIHSLGNSYGPCLFDYQGRPVCTVEVCGITVKLERREKFSSYTVDDGTGTIECIEWNNNDRTVAQTCKDPDNLDQSLLDKWREAGDNNSEIIQLSDLITIQGKIKFFRGNRQISCQHIRVETDPMYEAFHMAKIVDLYRNFYNKPVCEIVNTSPRVQVEYQIRSEILRTCLQNRIQTITLEDLFTFPEIQQLSKETEFTKAFEDIIRFVLKKLEAEGHLCQKVHKKELTYIVVSVNDDMKSAIVDILKEECKKTKYLETGCHYLHVHGELRKLVDYSRVSKEAVLSCLEVLESHSEVISTEHGWYTHMQM